MKLGASLKVAWLAGLLLLIEGSARSAVLPGAAEPGVVSRALTEQQPQPAAQVLPPVVTPAQKAPTPGGEQAKKIKFQLNGNILEGNCVYKSDQLLPLYKNKLHKVITVAELFEIVQNI